MQVGSQKSCDSAVILMLFVVMMGDEEVVHQGVFFTHYPVVPQGQ